MGDVVTTWKDTARVCTHCGKPEAFPSDTRFGTRHDCSGCKRWAWGEGQFHNAHEHAEARERLRMFRQIEGKRQWRAMRRAARA